MALVLKDRVLETCTSPGTGTITLLGAVTGYQAFSTVGNGNTCYYAIADQNGANWECGIGTYSSGTLARTTVLSSSNAGSLTNFSTGTQNVFLTYPSERSVNLSSAALTSGRVTYATTDGLLTDSANFQFNGSNVGIGVTPGGSTRLSVTASSGSLATFQQTGATGYGLTIVPGADTTYDAFTINNAANTLNQIRMFGNGNATFAGSVGIGTTTPTQKLTVYETSLITAPAAGTSQLTFGDNASDFAGRLFYNHGNDNLQIFVNSAERMRITDTGNVGIGTSSPAGRLDVEATTGIIRLASSTGTNAAYLYTQNTGGDFYIGRDNSTGTTFGTNTAYSAVLWSAGAYPMAFFTNGTERMRVTSAGDVGIGTSSPSSSRVYIANIGNANSGSYKITQRSALTLEDDTVNTNGPTVLTIAGNQAGASPTNSARISLWGQGYTGVSTEASRIDLITSQGSASTNVNGNLTFSTSSNSTTPTERMRISSSGDLLVGTTTSVGKLTVSGSVNSVNGALNVAGNGGFYNGANKFGLDHAGDNTRMYSSGPNSSTSGGFEFHTTDSTGALDTIRMFLSGTGNLGIGAASPSTKLHVQSANGNYGSGTDETGMVLAESTYNTTGSNNNASFIAKNRYGYSQFMQWENFGLRIGNRATTNSGAGEVVFTYGNDSEAMRISSAGNVGIGTSSPSTAGNGGLTLGTTSVGKSIVINSSSYANNGVVNFNGTDGNLKMQHGLASSTLAYIYAESAVSLAFYAGATERMRIDASGNLLVGTTSQIGMGEYCFLRRTGANESTIVAKQNDGSGGYNFYSIAQNNGGSYYHSVFFANTTENGSIISNGTTTTYAVTSDYRLKTVIGAITGYGARIDALKPIDYLWTDGGQQARGFLAHEFQTVYPSSVNGSKDAVDANGNPKYQSMQASTAEVIADLVAEIQSLRQRITTLEN
jgi:hypothetical protein